MIFCDAVRLAAFSGNDMEKPGPDVDVSMYYVERPVCFVEKTMYYVVFFMYGAGTACVRCRMFRPVCPSA